MPKLIGKSSRVVDHDGLSIDELAGNVATKQDTLSVAHVVIDKPTSEPWLTLHYDEWICLLRGKVEFHYEENGKSQVLTATAGETVMIKKGERFRPVFPEGNTEYIPVCLPAFKPERCIREDGDGPSDVSQRLSELHGKENTPEASEKLYHMSQKSLWDQAVASGKAYFPPTFEKDGNFTHATAVPSRLVTTANHFYTSVPGEWICLELSHDALKNKAGIITIFEEAKPVGQTAVSEGWTTWICPHIYGGIPVDPNLGVVTKIYPMKRDDKGNFLCIEGLTE